MSASQQLPVAAVAGPATCDQETAVRAHRLGGLLADAGFVVVTGGRGGVMGAVSRGASDAGGLVIALLPGTDRRDATPWADVVLPTGLGEARNALVARAGDVLIAFLAEGGAGTLSEVALALKAGVPVILVGARVELPVALPDGAVLEHAATVEEAAGRAVALTDGVGSSGDTDRG